MHAGILYAGSLWLSNSAYLYLSVSFIQMTKSLMPGLVYMSGIMLATEKFSIPVTLNMLLIAFGVVICALGETNLVVMGLIQQLAALGFEVRAHAAPPWHARSACVQMCKHRVHDLHARTCTPRMGACLHAMC